MTKRGIGLVSFLVLTVTALILSFLNFCCANTEEYEPDNSIITLDLSRDDIVKIADLKNLLKENLGRDYDLRKVDDDNIIIKLDPSKTDLSDKNINLSSCTRLESVLLYRDKSTDKDVLKIRFDCPYIVDIIIEDDY